MTKEAGKADDRTARAGPVELTEKELGEAAGGESSYANSFTCIPATASMTDGTQADPRIAALKR